MAQTVKNLPAMQEAWVPSLHWEDSLGKGLAPLQCSCLKNSMVRGAWSTTVHGVSESDITELLTQTCTIVLVSGVQCNGWIFIYTVK